jgi:MFS family permease
VHKNIRLLTYFNFFLDFRLFAPVAVLYFQKVTGSFVLAMAVFSVVFISSAIFEIPTGVFSDRIGRKKTMVMGTIATTLGLVFYAIGGSAIFLYIGAVFEGLGRSLYSGNNEALLHATLKESQQEDQYHVFLGKTSAMFQIASAVAAIVGGVLAYWSFSLVMWVSVIPALLCLLCALQVVEPKVFVRESTNIYDHLSMTIFNFRKNKKLRTLSLARMIEYGFGNAGFEFQSAFYSLIWPTWALGVARMVANTAGAAGFYLSGKVITRFSAFKMLIVESVVSPLVKILSMLLVTPLSPLLMAGTSLFYGFGSVAGDSLQQQEFSDEQRATMESFVSLGGSLCLAAASVLLGSVADRWGVVAALFLVQLISLANNFFYWQLHLQTRS